ncbi:UNVERIFIED_CONTAM: Mannan endo-1,4-beta-mannosidase 2 [Sesamum latifolium]|uniref:mannan endo-1,4-beta-mannosidase n=1 Tax=Sesamum latifolium TaxID=2727402 RepID=A0AAW2X3J5_9LAMI
MSLASGFVQTRGTHFELDNSLFLFNGFNAYWMMQVAAQPSQQRYKVSNVFHEAAAAGLTVCRTWAFSDGGNKLALQISPGVYDENVFQALDFVVSEAAKNKVRLILSLVNNYQDFGGRAQYVDWARNTGVRTSSDDDFYTNAVVKQYYKNHVKEIDFTTIHAYPDAWLSGQDDDAQMAFMRKWITSHWTDSRTLLKKPMIFTEFGNLARSGGIGGGLVWQLVAEGMESYSDGYEIDLFQTPSTSSVISQQSRQMTALQHKMSRP